MEQITQGALPLRAHTAADRRVEIRRGLADAARLIGARAQLLDPEDQALLRALFEDGRSAAEMARLIGVTARSIRRRVARLLTRIASPRFVFVGSHLDAWPRTRRRVATLVILRGRSARETARLLRISEYAVRCHLQAINALFESAVRGT